MELYHRLAARVKAIDKGGPAVSYLGLMASGRIRGPLAEALGGLTLRALAFRTGTNGERIHVPAAVRRAVPLPLPMRFQLSAALAGYDAATIGRIYAELCNGDPTIDSRASRTQDIAR